MAKLALAALCAFGGLLHAATVHRAPLKTLLIDNASVVTNVTGLGRAHVLESAQGGEWITGDGVVHRLQRRAVFNGMTAVENVSEIGEAMSWSFDWPESTGSCTLYFDPPSLWRLEIVRMEDVEENGEIVQNEVVTHYEGSASWGASSVTVREGFVTHTIALETLTNSVDRLALASEIPTDFAGGLTTNDVCSIVTNEVVEGYSVYVDGVRYPEAEVYFDFIGHEDAEYLYGVSVAGTMIFERSCMEKDVNELKSEGFSGITEDEVGDIIQGSWLEVKPVKRNKLGLATNLSLETKRDLTNNVAYAEGIGFSPWEFSCDIPEIHAAVSGAKIDMWYNGEQGNWQVGELPYVEGWESASGEYAQGGIDATNLLCRGFYFRSGEAAELRAVRKRIVVATPGEVYATPKYIRSTAEEIAREVSKGLHKTVTNVARAVSNSFWDERNEVLWRMEFRDGEPMFVPVTNENVKASGGVL